MSDHTLYYNELNAHRMVEVAAAIGLIHSSGDHWGSCPACGAETCGGGDRRGPLLIGRGWRCLRSGCASEDSPRTAHNLIGWVGIGQVPVTREDHEQVHAIAYALTLTSVETDVPAPPTPPRRASPPDDAGLPEYPPIEDVERLWGLGLDVRGAMDALAWVRREVPALGGFWRGVDMTDAVRYLPWNAPGPEWMRFEDSKRFPHQYGYQIMMGLYDYAGVMRNIRFRYLGAERGDMPKGLSRGKVKGLVFADAAALRFLRADPYAYPEAEGPLQVWICEGGTDWLSQVVWARGEEEIGGSTGSPPSFLATLAVFSGSWSPEMAAKIPDGSEVVLALDNDKTGERYAREILGTLGPGVGVSDWKGEEGEDRRDALRRWLDASGPTS